MFGDYENIDRVPHEGRSVFWEVIVSAILNKSIYIAISLHRRATRHVLTQVAKCIDIDGGIFENILY
jgi:hypothetical protein